MCQVVSQPPEDHEGLSEEQEKALKNIKGTDDEKWRDLWRILSPGDSDRDIRDRCKS
jgi:hypothetical protein